ncbi:MAG: DNA polymerase I [Bacillota bacterium]
MYWKEECTITPKMIIVDGNSLMFRAFYALPPLTTSTGVATNAIHGFLNMLIRILGEEKPTHVAVAFDLKGPTFRHEAFTQYKAGRKPTPDELNEQLQSIRRLLAAMGIRVVTKSGYEADDLLGTLAVRAQEEEIPVLLVTGDRDALQLVDDGIEALITKRGITQIERFDRRRIEEEYGIPPKNLIDVKGLMGDVSDNIPGVPGIGEKSALKLIAQFGTLETLLDNIGEVKGNKQKELLETYSGQALLSKKLGAIDCHVDVDVALEDLRFAWPSPESIYETFMEFELKSIYRRIAAKSEAGDDETAPLLQAFAAKEIEVRDLDMLQSVVEEVRSCGEMAFTLQPELTIAAGSAMVYRIVDTHTLLEPGMDQVQVFSTLRLLFEDAGVEKTVYDVKTVLHKLHGWDLELKGRRCDVMIAAYLLDPAQGGASIETLSERYLGESASHAAAVMALGETMVKKLEKEGMASLFWDVEMPLAAVLYHMELLGFCVDTRMLASLNADYASRLETLTEEIHELSGRHFNINSPRQLGEVLFDELGLASGKKTKTGYSTDIEVLEGLASEHPVVPRIIEYRKIQKLKATYVEGLLRAANPVTHRVHTSFKQTVTATGRISSIEPNLQNIPVKTEMGREIRKVFVPGKPGHVLIGADYSQIELRVLAHISCDAVLIDAFRNGQDIHARTAAEVFGTPISEVTPYMRSSAKAVNFGIVYGISDFGLSRNLGISRKQAGDYINRYLERYTGVRTYMDEIVERGKRDGYVKTLMGRRRYLPELVSPNYNVRSFGKRVALNTPIQGTAADIIKVAMVRVDRTLKEKRMEARLILQVHDELILESPEDEAERAAEILKDCMENVIELSVPLVVDVRTGYTWFDAK